MSRILRILLPLAIALAVSGIVRVFFTQVSSLSSLLIGGTAGAFVFLGETLDFVKKSLEVEKLRREIAKLRREASEKEEIKRASENLVQLATPDEVEQYGCSYTERRLTAHYKLEEERERLTVRTFVERAKE